MTFEFGDQPDYYTTAQLPRYWDLSNDMNVASGEGYGGADAWEGDAAGAYAVKYPAVVDTTRFGFVVRMKIDSLPGAAMVIMGAPDETGLQVCCVLNTDGTVSIYRGDAGGTLLATSVDVLPDDGSTFRVAFQGVISPTSGSATVFFAADDDPLTEIAQAGGVNTDDTGSGVRRGVYLGGAPDVFTSMLYTQGAGTLPADPLCDVVLPDIDTALQQWQTEPGSSPTNIANVTDDNPANDDTDYGYSSSVGEAFALEMVAVTARLQTLGVRLVATVLGIDNSSSPPASPPVAATFTYTPLIRNEGGALQAGPFTSVGNADWIGVDLNAATDPFTGLPFTSALVNAYGWGGMTTV